MEKEKALVTVGGGNALTEKEVVSEAIAFAQKGFGGMPVTLPKGYDLSRAVKNFCFALPDVKNIERATKESIMQAAHDYITQGLDVAKHQCALIVYGDKLIVQREYFGSVNQAMRLNPDIKEISHGTVIHEGENASASYDDSGRLHIVYKPELSLWNKPVTAAYVVVTYRDGTTDAEFMTIEEIREAWAMSRNGDKVHKQFPAEMCKKTVLNRLCKKLINKSDDAAIIEDIDERQTVYGEVVDIDAAEYAEDYEPEPTVETPSESQDESTEEDYGDLSAEDYCITVPYSEYISDYKSTGCATANYNQKTKTIDVYPNRPKK